MLCFLFRNFLDVFSYIFTIHALSQQSLVMTEMQGSVGCAWATAWTNAVYLLQIYRFDSISTNLQCTCLLASTVSTLLLSLLLLCCLVTCNFTVSAISLNFFPAFYQPSETLSLICSENTLSALDSSIARRNLSCLRRPKIKCKLVGWQWRLLTFSSKFSRSELHFAIEIGMHSCSSSPGWFRWVVESILLMPLVTVTFFFLGRGKTQTGRGGSHPSRK